MWGQVGQGCQNRNRIIPGAKVAVDNSRAVNKMKRLQNLEENAAAGIRAADQRAVHCTVTDSNHREIIIKEKLILLFEYMFPFTE